MSTDPTASDASFDDLLRKLVTERAFSQMNFEDALIFFCKTLSSALGVSRVGVWELNETNDAIHALVLWDQETDQIKQIGTLTSDDAGSYLDAIDTGYVVEISDALNDPRCRELARRYLPESNVAAMLDCPIRTFGGMAGVVCIEQVGQPREWTRDEVNFAVAVTGLVSLTMEHHARIIAENAATENENRLKIYTELATDWYWQTDDQYRFTVVEGLPALDGQVPEDYIGLRLWDLPILAPLEGNWNDLQTRMDNRKRIYDYVIYATDASGVSHYAELAGIAKYDANGRFSGYWGTAKDVSDRVRQNLKLACMYNENDALLQQLNLIFETCGIGAYRYDGRSRQLSYDKSFLTLYGLDSDFGAEPGQFTDSKVHPDERDEMKAFIRNAMFGNDTQGSHLFRAYKADGQLAHMRTFWKLENIDPDGSKNIIGLHMDVTDVITAQQERSKALEHIAAIAENIPGGIFEVIWQKDAPTELVYISPKCAEIWQHSQAEVMANPRIIASGKHSEALQAVMAANNEAISTGATVATRLPMSADDGAVRWVDYRVQSFDQGDGTHRVYGIFIDVSNEVLAQEEAEKLAELAHRTQKNESIGQLTGGVAHDFNNMLAVIMGNLELLREGIDDTDQREMIDAGIMASQRGADLTRSLLAFARKSRLKPEALDLNDVARQAQNWMRRALPESVKVETSLLAGLWSAELDAASLESALLNLILNARDAMNGHGNLTIETANVRIDQAYVDARNEELSPGRYVMLAVSDTGAGIDAETLEQIFEPFFTTKPPGAGSGVGLSMVLGFVKQSGGTVQVYTELGHGTTFKLYFPAKDDRSETKTSSDAPEGPHANGEARILLVEDDKNVRTVLLTMLKTAGYEVVPAHSGDAAFERFNSDPTFDLVVTDIVMPGRLQGTNLAKVLRQTYPHLPFIFMSGYAAEATVHGNGLRPEDIRLMKPVPKTELLSAVAHVLANAAKQ